MKAVIEKLVGWSKKAWVRVRRQNNEPLAGERPSHQPSRGDIVYAATKALLGKVTSSLREVGVAQEGSEMILYAVYDAPILEKEQGLMEDVRCELEARLEFRYTVKSEILRVDFPERRHMRGFPVFARHEV